MTNIGSFRLDEEIALMDNLDSTEMMQMQNSASREKIMMKEIDKQEAHSLFAQHASGRPCWDKKCAEDSVINSIKTSVALEVILSSIFY